MSTSNPYSCTTCLFSCKIFSEIIDHNIIRHPEQTLIIKVYIQNKCILQTKNFCVIPNQLQKDGYYIHSDNYKETLNIGKTCDLLETASTLFEIENDNSHEIGSPVAKRQKISTSTPRKSDISHDLKEQTDEEMETEGDKNKSFFDIDADLSRELLDLSISDDNYIDSDIEEMRQLLPILFEKMKTVNQKYN